MYSLNLFWTPLFLEHLCHWWGFVRIQRTTPAPGCTPPSYHRLLFK